ncbi:MAG: cupredoxin domain-containing protein [Nanoarchaeota archaeon]|nr:cupredoxin domain-containing protein [Nanoarchaeota archaeon]
MKYFIVIFILLLVTGCSLYLAEGIPPDNKKIGPLEEEPHEFMINDVKVIKMTVRQWEFIPSKINVSLGEKVRLEIISEDIQHGIEIMDLNISKRILPGEVAIIEFVPEKEGIFKFRSTVYSGIGFKDMTGVINVKQKS